MKKIVACGAFDIGSVGDEAALEFLRTALPVGEIDLTVLVRSPSEEYGRKRLVNVQRKLEHSSLEQAKGRNLRGFNADETTETLMPLFMMLEEADLLLLGPGAFINEQSKHMLKGALQEMYVMSLLADLAGCPYMIWGASANRIIDPILHGMVKDLVKRSVVTVLRDSLSLRRLILSGAPASKIRVIPDPVLGWDMVPMWKNIKKDHVAVSVRDVSHVANQERFEAVIADVVIELLRDGTDITFVPHFVDGSKRDDLAVIDRIVVLIYYWFYENENPANNRYRDIRVLYDNDLPAIEEVYREVKCVIGTRLHSCVMAARCGAPIVPLSYDPKIDGFIADAADGGHPVINVADREFSSYIILEAMRSPFVVTSIGSFVRELHEEYKKLFSGLLGENR